MTAEELFALAELMSGMQKVEQKQALFLLGTIDVIDQDAKVVAKLSLNGLDEHGLVEVPK